MKNEIIKPAFVLFIITFAAALLLGAVNVATKNIVTENKRRAKNSAMSRVLLYTDDFSEEVRTGNDIGVISWSEGTFEGNTVGYVIEVAVKGYCGDIVFLAGIGENGMIKGVNVLSHAETPGLGAYADSNKFTNQFIGRTGGLRAVKTGARNENEIDAITAATITSAAVTEGVNEAYKFYEELISEVR